MILNKENRLKQDSVRKNKHIIKSSNCDRRYEQYGFKAAIIYFLVTKCEIEKMLLYILQSFLPTDHFIDLANLFHMESVCSKGIFRFQKTGVRHEKPSKIESAIMQLSTYCYIHFNNALETNTSDRKKNESHIFFRYLLNVNVILNIYINPQQNLYPKELIIRNNCFCIYIQKNADKLCKKLTRSYNDLVVILNNMQNKLLSDLKPDNEKTLLQNEITNKYNKINDNALDEKNCKLKNKPNIDKNVEKIVMRTKFNTAVFYILNYISIYILACEAIFLMSYDITSDKKIIEDLIDYYMKIIKDFNDTNYNKLKLNNIDISFKRPQFSK
ncbi:hypothetical protein BDAP_002653 [Binucleata daphniae]